MKDLDVGINIGDAKTRILLYADDIVLLTSSETELQILLSALSDWCATNSITAKTVAQSANRALSLLIAKHKIMGGLHCDAFT